MWGAYEKISVQRAWVASALSSRHGVARQVLRVRTGCRNYPAGLRDGVLVRGRSSPGGNRILRSPCAETGRLPALLRSP